MEKELISSLTKKQIMKIVALLRKKKEAEAELSYAKKKLARIENVVSKKPLKQIIKWHFRVQFLNMLIENHQIEA